MQIKPHYFNIDLLFSFVKSSELVMVFIHLLNGLIFNSTNSFVLSIIIIVNSYFNYFLKHSISKPLFNIFNDYIPIFGKGPRPFGASDCGYFSNCPKIKATSFGFPSGHSQFAGLHAAFLIRDIISKKSVNNTFTGLNINDKISVILIFTSVPLMMYSRVYIEGCHTIEQTIFGAIIGYCIGHYSYNVYNKYKSKIQKKLNLDSAYTKIILFFVFIFLFNI